MKIYISNLAARKGEGGSTYLSNILQELSKLQDDNEYSIFARNEFVDRMRILIDDNRFTFLHPRIPQTSLLGRMFWEQLLFPFILLKHKADILFCPGNSGTIFSPCPMILMMQQEIRFSSIYVELISIRKLRLLLMWAASIVSLRFATFIIFISKDLESRIVNRLKLRASKCNVIHHGLDPSFFKRDEGEMERVRRKYCIDDEYILFVANIKANKNIEVIIRAYNILIEENFNLPKLLIVGRIQDRDYFKQMSKLMQQMKNNTLIEFIGEVDYDDMPGLYSSARVLIFPSKNEAFGFPMLEAMGCEVPILSSNATALPEIGGDAAAYFEPSSALELAALIKKVLSDGEYSKSLINKGLERVRLFTWESAARKLLDIFYCETC
jgi:glycosyltransferase involved in cell wall biosynthesis